jgi:hypothetical protein
MREFMEEDVNEEKYPPFFQFHVVRDVALGFAVEF